MHYVVGFILCVDTLCSPFLINPRCMRMHSEGYGSCFGCVSVIRNLNSITVLTYVAENEDQNKRAIFSKLASLLR